MKHYLVIVNEQVGDEDTNHLYAYVGEDLLHAVEQFQDDPYILTHVKNLKGFEVQEVEGESHLFRLAAEKRGIV